MPSMAQLTMFYAGTVNVYNEVPLDKAHAIMLLARSGSSWSSSYVNPQAASDAATGRNPFQKTPMAAPRSTPSSAPGSRMASPHPLRSGVVFSNVRQSPIASVELPQARKASLARFLEKRKDRVRKLPLEENVDSASAASRDKSPDPSTRSPSPSPAAAVKDQRQQHPGASRSPPTVPRPRRDSGSSSEPNSPPTKPPGRPPRQNLLDSEIKNSPTPKRLGHSSWDEVHFVKRARDGRSHKPEESMSL